MLNRQDKMCCMKVHAEQEVPVQEDSENYRIAHNGCPEHWHNDLRRSNETLNTMTMEELIKCFELFDLASEKSHQKKKKNNGTVQFNNKDPKNIFFCKNHSPKPVHNAKQYRLEMNR